MVLFLTMVLFLVSGKGHCAKPIYRTLVAIEELSQSEWAAAV